MMYVPVSHDPYGKQRTYSVRSLRVELRSHLPSHKHAYREGNGNPLQYSCLKNPMDRGTWQAVVHRSHSVRHH